ncbi:MAG: exodeoxyribonuclease V subunit alpha [Myxococcota bacterium]
MTRDIISELSRQGLVDSFDSELARALCAMVDGTDGAVELAVALTSRHVRHGHACMPLDPSAVRPLSLASPEQSAWSKLPAGDTWVETVRQSALTVDGPLVVDPAGRLYLRRYFEFERDIARALGERSALERNEPIARSDDVEESLDRLLGKDPGPRRQAAENALAYRVSVLCGGPGTGKTTTVAAIAACLVEGHQRGGRSDPKVLLLAPTGKAAARLGGAVVRAKATLDTDDKVLACIPDEATTLHRALGMRRQGLSFRRGPDFPLDADVVVVDEASMVDLALMRQLLISISPRAKLLIVGDPDQLSSVEAGSVLRDLVRAGDETWWKGRVTTLTTTYRYDGAATLGRLVGALRSGDIATMHALLEAHHGEVALGGVHELDTELDEAARRWGHILEPRDPEEHFARRGGFVVLSAFRRGPFGTAALGRRIAEKLPGNRSESRPIIVEENRHELGLYNGDLGLTFDRDGSTWAVVERARGAIAEFAAVRLPRHADGFALSVHKAQGSEFDEVLVVLPDQPGPLLTRELLYTAVSRARRRVRLVGSAEVIALALSERARRFSGLVDRIAELAPPR